MQECFFAKNILANFVIKIIELVVSLIKITKFSGLKTFLLYRKMAYAVSAASPPPLTKIETS